MAKSSTSFQPGQSPNPGGRPKSEIKMLAKGLTETIIEALVDDSRYKRFVMDFDGLPPESFVRNYIELMKLAIPLADAGKRKTLTANLINVAEALPK